MSDGAGIDVVIPVYGAAEALERCLVSLARYTDLARHRVVLVLDGPQPPEVEHALAALPGAELLRLARRGGFAAAANRGVAAVATPPGRDVVLLNADTQVAAGWLAGLARAAASGPRVATVTPLTNVGTIAAVPRWLEENLLPAGYDVDRFAALVSRVSRRLYPRLPTGVGHCLWLRRAALDELGGFDEAAWGLGYGEETDYCLRAAARGWEHRLDDATFVFHEGQASFGAARERRVRRAERRLRRRFPRYWGELAAFLAADPLREARAPLLAALARESAAAVRPGGKPAPVVHVVHGWPPWSRAGTEIYAARLVESQAATGRPVSVYARQADPTRTDGAARERLEGGVRVRLVVNNFRRRDPLARNALLDRRGERDFARFLAEERPAIAHLHHLAGHGLGLARVAARHGAAVVWQLQDWWGLCARANLLDAGRRLCPGPAAGRCARCLPLTALPPAPLLNRALHVLRRQLVRRAMGRAALFVAGSAAVVETYRAERLLPPGARVAVLDYGVPPPAGGERPPRERAPGAPLVVGFLGSLLPHKGAHRLAAAAATLTPGSVELRLWGDPTIDPAYADEIRRAAGGARCELRGRFDESEREAAMAEIDLLAVPSLGLESFGIAPREALARGIPVLAARRGALAELFGGRAEGRGALFDPDRPEELAALLARAAAEPDLLRRWVTTPAPVPTSAAHAVAVDALYAELLAGAPDPGRRRARLRPGG